MVEISMVLESEFSRIYNVADSETGRALVICFSNWVGAGRQKLPSSGAPLCGLFVWVQGEADFWLEGGALIQWFRDRCAADNDGKLFASEEEIAARMLGWYYDQAEHLEYFVVR